MPPSLRELDEKLKKIDNAEKSEEAKERARKVDAENTSMGFRAGAELVGSIVAGVFFGWFIDDYFGTKPIFLIILFLLGVVTGFVNVWRTSQGIGTTVGYSQLHKQKKQAKTPAEEQES